MKPKINMKKLIANIKKGAPKEVKSKTESPRPLRIDIDYTKPPTRHRDMRQDAMDMGSHGASEFFGGSNAGTI